MPGDVRPFNPEIDARSEGKRRSLCDASARSKTLTDSLATAELRVDKDIARQITGHNDRDFFINLAVDFVDKRRSHLANKFLLIAY